MTDVRTTPAAAIPTKPPRKAGKGDANPANAGWATKLVLAALCLMWFVPILGTLITSFQIGRAHV